MKVKNLIPTCAILISVSMPMLSHASNLTWNAGNGTTTPADATGTWSTATPDWWSSASSPSNNWPSSTDTTDVAVFGTTTNATATFYTVTVNGNVGVNGITFNNPSSNGDTLFTLSSGTITFGGTTPTITANNGNFNTKAETISSTIIANNGLTYAGTGWTYLQGNNTISNLTINGGTVSANGAGALGASTDAITVNNAAVLNFQASTSGLNFGGGTITLNNTATLNSGSNGSFSNNVVIAGTGNTLGLNNNTMSGSLSGTANVNLSAGGSAILSGQLNTYTGTLVFVQSSSGVKLQTTDASTLGFDSATNDTTASVVLTAVGTGTATGNVSTTYSIGALTGKGGSSAVNSITLSTVSSSTSATITSSTGFVYVGEVIYGNSNLAAGTYITAYNSTTGAVTLSTKATTGGTSVASTVEFPTDVLIGANTTGDRVVFQLGNTNTNTTYGGAIMSSASTNAGTGITKVGTGTLTLTGVNTYTLPTTVNNGVLNLAGSSSASSTATATTTASTTVTLTSGSTSPLRLGQTVSGTGIPAGAYVTAILSSTQFTISAAATAGSPTLTFGAYSGVGSSNVVVNSGSTLALSSDAIHYDAGNMTLNGSGYTGQSGALVNTAGANTYAGLITLGSASTISVDAGLLALTNTGTITGSGNNLTLAGSGTGQLASNVGTGTGGLIKNGTGTWTLSNASNYSGGTAVTAGTLYVNGGVSGTSSGTGTGAVTVSNGATLGGSGAIKATSGAGVTINSGATLASGSNQSANAVVNGGTGAVNGTGTGGGMTIDNSAGLSSALNIQGGAILTFALGSTTAYNGGSGALNFANPNTDSTYLSLTGSTVDQIFANTLTADTIKLVDLTNGAAQGSNSLTLRSQNPYLLISSGLTSNADFANLVTSGGTGANGYVLGVSNGAGGYTAFSLGAYDINGNPISSGTNLEGLQLYLFNGDLEVVPEPGTWALMISGLAVLIFWQRRRGQEFRK